ncbi:hypothetical protein [Alkalicoccus urumqiensis]|uniref:Uncharacterized protein n=1 Tax=Alkalicoccus urumqiensis TaxID=1548213 RepID=A0A2P6MH77_ALKUR|nr:hypothetical protein [Alkalicoccus urumqiensis]PRO65639.1 hypothetical protein C6I21_08945 [Alkalicoccus urumqiensis]
MWQKRSGSKASLPETGKAPGGVFLTEGGHSRRAPVFFARGETAAEAADKLWEAHGNPEAPSYKIDIAGAPEAAAGVSWQHARRVRLALPPRKYGLLFGEEDSPLAFLPEEVAAWGMVTEDGKLQPERVLEAASRRGNEAYEKAVELFLTEEWLDVYRFETVSYYVDDTGIQRVERGQEIGRVAEKAELMRAMTLASEGYFQHAVSFQGRFLYSYDPHTGYRHPKYNLLRHAGTLFSMLQMHETLPDAGLLPPIQKARRYLVQQMKQENDTYMAVEKKAVKLGGNGLALIALVKYAEVTGDHDDLPIMRGLAKWMHDMAETHGRLKLHKQTLPDKKDTGFTSHYYSGEAILSLVRLYQLEADERWLDTAEKEAAYLIHDRDKNETYDTIAHDHWLLYALNELDQLRPNDDYKSHSFFIADAIVQAQRGETDDPEWEGSYEMKGAPRSTPVACRSEGLCAAVQTARRAGEADRSETYRKAAAKGIAFQMKLQFTPVSVLYYEPSHLLMGAFQASTQDAEIRNDYTQHNVSSFYEYVKLLENE